MNSWLESSEHDSYKLPAETYGYALKIWAKERRARHLDEVDGDQDLVLEFTEAWHFQI